MSCVGCTGATLVGWLGLVWARALVLAEVVGQLGCPDLTPVSAIKTEGERRQ